MVAERRGFTLVELMAALSLTGLVLLGAQAMLSQLGDARDRSQADVARAAREANGVALLRDLVLRVERAPDTLEALVGDRSGVWFLSRCDVPAGWQERCVVTLALEQAIDSTRLMLESPVPRLMLARLSRDAELRYVDADREWLTIWRRQLQLPVAIAVVGKMDTLVLRVGVR